MAAHALLWFAEKFVSLLIEQHRISITSTISSGCDLLKNSYLCLLNNTILCELNDMGKVVICWKIRIFAYWTTPTTYELYVDETLWFAEKFVSLLIEQHPSQPFSASSSGCDLLKNSYLCLLNNTVDGESTNYRTVVICWKIRIFAYWTTPYIIKKERRKKLWFAEKFVSLLIEQHPQKGEIPKHTGLWFAEKFVSLLIEQHRLPINQCKHIRCDLLKNSYLCLLNNTTPCAIICADWVVICWKIRIFAYWTTPYAFCSCTIL